MPTDEELMAALFVNDEGEIRCKPDWVEDGIPEPGWKLLHLIPDAVAAGILRLIRERDEARQQWEARLDTVLYLEGLTKRLMKERQLAGQERDEARDLVAFIHDHAPALCGPDDWSVWDRVKKALRAWKK